MDKVNVGNGPIAVTVDPPVESLAETRFLSPEDINTLRSYREKFITIYIANKNSKEITVIRMDILRNRVEEVFNVNVDWNPVALTADPQRWKVYVANYGYDNLSVVDILKIVKGNRTGAVSAISNVGTSSIGVVADPSLDRVYLLKESTDVIMIIRPPEEQAPRIVMPPIIGNIPVGNSPRALILDPEARKLYVVNRGANTVSVIDKTTRKEEMVVPVGKRPYGIAMFPF
jgi:YVTN family beta-propeller protein